MGTVGLGGLFLRTPNPLALGSTVELLFDVANGNEVRARAIVRNVRPGKGMGVKFVHMGPEDRSRLNQFLKTQLQSGNIQDETGSKTAADVSTKAADHARTVPSVAPLSNFLVSAIRGAGTPAEQPVSEQELKIYVAMAENCNYYQLLGVTTDCSKDQIKQSFYALARKSILITTWAKPNGRNCSNN